MNKSPSPSHTPRSLRALALMAIFGLLSMILSPVLTVRADVISNNVDITVDTALENMNLTAGGPNGSTQLRVITASDDGKNGCNLTGQTTLVVNVVSSTPGVVTVSPNQVTFTSCGATPTLTVTPVAQGSTDISLSLVSNNSGGSFDLAPAAFTVHVAAPTPTNAVPTFTPPANITAEATGSAGAVINFTASGSDSEDGAIPAVCDPVSGSTFEIGTTNVSCTVTDSKGAQATGSFTVTVQDTTAPTVNVPNNTTRQATGPNGKVVNYADENSAPIATDAVDGNITPTCSPASGTEFPLGTTTVTCTATDAHHNTGSASFTITVEDTTGPVVTVPENVTAEASGASGATVSFTASASDAVDGSRPVTCSPNSGSTYALGTTTVNCSATDTRGNEGTASFTVTVQDKTAPVLTLPNDITQEATGPNGAAVSYTATASDLVDGSVSVSCSPNSGSTFAFGATTVNCSATDAHGNTATGSFTVTIEDTTEPDITVPDDITTEATGSTGAVATFSVSATDLVDGDVEVSCTPTSGTTFALGDTTVTCMAEDATGNQATASFTVRVVDTTAPDLDLPESADAEATGPDGAAVSFIATASDIVDGAVNVICIPASGDSFPVGDTTVSCSATDEAGNEATGSFSVTVTDTTPPTVTVPVGVVAEATGPSGASATFTATAQDLVDGSIVVSCTPESGSTFPLGTTEVNCSATDAHDNTGSASFNVTVRDTTPPTIAVPADITVEATGPSGALATYTVTASDLVDGTVMVSCSPISGSTFGLGATTVNCSATDAAGNSGGASFNVTVQDTTAPSLSIPANMTVDPTSAAGAAVTYTASASDLVDGTVAVTCTPLSGSVFPANKTTPVNCSATDAHGNTATGSFQITVNALTRKGFYQPVDMGTVLNTVKAGSTVPLKFEVFAGSTELTDISIVTGIKVAKVNMSTSTLTDEIETTATGGTSLRYDSTSGQFIYNWSTKGLLTGQCYQVTLTLQDGSTIVAYFKMK